MIARAPVIAACLIAAGPPGLWAGGARYAFAPRAAAHDRKKPIDVEAHNRAVSRRLLSARKVPKYPIVIVPGYTPLDASRPYRLHPIAAKRLAAAVKAFRRFKALAILVTGGNVHPPGTPYNEALQMKRHLVRKYKLGEDRIALEPYARHSTTNLRNAGRFMLAHEIRRAMIVTSAGQSFYFSFASLSTFHLRGLKELGYRVGKLRVLSPQRTSFLPSARVFERGKDPLDP